jgi:hypothetical protein
MTRTVLSATVGIPIAIFAMLLWLVVELWTVAGRRRRLLQSWAVLTTAVLFVLIAARFMKYS